VSPPATVDEFSNYHHGALRRRFVVGGDHFINLRATGDSLEQHERTERPLGSERFVEKAEQILQRQLKKKKPVPKSIYVDN
jgi:hypothetical protein